MRPSFIILAIRQSKASAGEERKTERKAQRDVSKRIINCILEAYSPKDSTVLYILKIMNRILEELYPFLLAAHGMMKCLELDT